MSWVAIANLSAGRLNDVERTAERLSRTGLVREVQLARQFGDTARLTRAAAGADGLVVVGGDGTVAQVLNSMDVSRQRLAVLPCGHGNCLARDLNVGNVDAALRALRAGRTVSIDIMRVSLDLDGQPPIHMLAASTLAVGYVADTVRFGRSRLGYLGQQAYAVASVLTRPRQVTMYIEIDDASRKLRQLTGVIVNNTIHLANFRTFLDACIDDGFLDVMEQSHNWLRQVLQNTAILAGSRAFGPTRLTQSRVVIMNFESPESVMVDGEIIAGVRRVEVHCEAKSLACIGNR